MHRLSICASLVCLAWAPAFGQFAPPNEKGVAIGHVHLVASDVDAAKIFWTALGGVHSTRGVNEVFQFPEVAILVRKGEPSGASIGSIVNHIGFEVPDLQKAVAKWSAAGLKIPPGPNPQQVFFFTPDNFVRVEVLEEPNQKIPLVFSHVHFNVVEPGSDGKSSTLAMQAWYAKTFGARPGKRKEFEAGYMPGGHLTFAKASTPSAAPTKGRALDHIGFEIKNLERFCRNLEADGAKFDVPFTKQPDLGISQAFLTDPWGTYIELTEH